MLLWLWTRSPRAFVSIAVAAWFSLLTVAHSLDLFVLPAFMLGIVAADLNARRHALSRFGLPLFAIVLATSFTLATPSQWDNFENPQLSAIGIASYSIYLIHEPVVIFLERHNAFPPIAAITSAIVGFAFWWIAERPFTNGPMRNRIIAQLERFSQRWFDIAGIGKRIQLEDTVQREPLAGSQLPTSNQ
ncbi:MAG: hypothetical protein ACXVAO_16895 [Vulcanimicrobiaceae bacterium]